MAEKKNVYRRLLDARFDISNTSIKKEGRNDYSKYDYFTPSQVSHLVSSACQEHGLLTTYSITEDEKGYRGELCVINVDNPDDCIHFYMSTAMPDIKATNESQRLGGMVTYNERYLKMSVFEIVDNNLDFDSQDNRSKPKQKSQSTPTSGSDNKLSATRFKKALKSLEDPAKKESTLDSLRTYSLTPEQIKQVQEAKK